MPESALHREIASLRQRNVELERQAADARQALAAFAHGEVDAVTLEASATPLLLRGAQDALRHNEQLLRSVFDGALDAMLLADDGGRYVEANPAACALFGLSRDELLGKSIAEFTAEGYDHEGAHRAFQEHGQLRGLFPLRRPDGTRRTLDYSARANVAPGLHLSVLRDVTGQVQDATDRRAAVDALRTSEERYRRIVETTSDGIWIYSLDGITTFMNGRMAEMLHCTLDDAVGKPVFIFIDPSERVEAEARIARRQQGVGERLDFAYRCMDGAALLASVQAKPMVGADGRVDGVLAVVTDVSAQRRADEARALLAAIVESSEDAIVGTSVDGTVMSWNRGAERLFGYSLEEAVGKSMLTLLPLATERQGQPLLDRIVGGEAIHQQEIERRRKDGSMVAVSVTISPIRDRAGTITGFSNISRDLTARRQIEATLRRTEDQFRQAQKMEAVGRLAGGVAHDFNNLLSVVLSYASMGLADLTPGDPVREGMEEIRKAGQRATELTQQLLAFSRQQVRQPRVLDINQILGGMQRMLARLLGEDVELTVTTAPGLGRVLADAGQVEQVIMNLVVNARDAMPDGGKLTIETANIELDTAYVDTHLGVAEGDYVLLAISDTGTGMDAATVARVFEPFFTTKETGKGTGLGLATVFGIVKQSGGQIGVYSELGRGTSFKIYLPRTDRVAEATQVPTSAEALRGSETILLVEDDAQVRAVARAVLRRGGYHVLETSNGGEALLISREFGARIHLLLTDVVMPRMSGRKVVEHLLPERPDMRVLYASGYTDDAIIHHGVLDAGVPFIQKPFTPDMLLRKVREVLDAPTQPGAARAT